MSRTKFLLDESEIPTHWYNVVADMPNPPAPPLGPDGKPYRAKQVVFKAMPVTADGGLGVRVTGVVDSAAPGRMVYDPKSPLANEQGYVEMSNVNVVEEMTNMISASRAYQTNAEIMSAAKTLLLKTLAIAA